MRNPFSNAPVYYRDVTGSTMDDSKKASSEGIRHGSVFRAGFQVSGRGRIRGRKWISKEGENLLFTLVLKRTEISQELNHLPLIAGVALQRAVSDFTGETFHLKWPNDIIYKGKKSSGILCEADSEYFYCGIGINCNQEIFSEELEEKSTSLKLITKTSIDLESLLMKILIEFKDLLNNGDSWRSELENCLYKKNQTIEIIKGQTGSDQIIRGINRGIGSDGQLLIEESDGSISEIYAGEIEI